METTVTVERLVGDETEDFLPSHEILRENLKAVHKKPSAKKRIKKIQCKICKEIFPDKATLELHENIHDPANPYACDKCTYKTHIKKYLSRHVRKVHNKTEYKQECEYCGKKFQFKCLLDKHVRVHTGEKPNVCDVCGKAFNSAYSLSCHKLIHTNEKPFKCAFCDHACRDSSSLRKHQNIHLGISKKYPCQECHKKYERKGLLQDHVKRVHRRVEVDESAKMKCDTCGKHFNSRRALVNHIKAVHNKSTTCVCGICGKHLAYSANLKSHMRSHLDIKPYKCTFPGCNNRYKEKSSVKKHAVIHYPEQQMYCDECGKGFTRRIRLIRHFAQHEPKVKNTKCTFCGVCFYNKNYLLNHMKTVHGKRTKLICDTCGFECLNKPGLVMHMKSVHMDRQCRICKKSFKRKGNLAKHYRYAHNTAVKTKSKIRKPMVVIKQEPLDLPDLEIDLLDIDKEEPFAGFDIESRDHFSTSLSSLQSLQHQNSNENATVGVTDDKVEPITSEDTESQPQFATTQVIQGATPSDNGQTKVQTQESTFAPEETENTSQANPVNRTMQVDEFIQHIMSNNDIQEEVISQPEDTTANAISEPSTNQAEPGRAAMPVDEFLQHMMSDTELPYEDVDVESEDYLNLRLNELIEESNKKNGIVKKNAALGRKLEKVHVDEISKFLFTNVNIEVDGKIITPLQNKQKIIVKKKKKKIKKRKRILEEDIEDDELEQYDRENELYDKEEESKEKKETEEDAHTENSVDERDSNTTKLNTGIKIKFDLHQCYVCFKLFPTKPQLIQHCKEHFDVCNEITLKKCPLCNFVTHHNIKRHMKLKHNTDINFSFMRIKDKKVNKNGSRYYFDTNDDSIKELEIIPSIKILNKKASMDLDKRNRELKDKSLLKRKLVRKGKEWIVETEKIDVSDHVVPKLKNNDDYLAKMKKLSVEAKKNKMKMLYPCNGCEKICQNLSALTLHMRRHDPNAKPFKPKKWQHKQKPEDKAMLPEEKEASPQLDISNRDAKPKPILNKHRCDPKLKAFYENNIKGGDIEFWQFLKIYNKMDRENVNDFEDLEARSDFGLHSYTDKTNNDKTVNNNEQETTSNCNISNINSSSNIKTANKDNFASKKVGKRIGKVKYVRKIQLSKAEYKRRCELKNKLREKFANNSC
ncbi:unnamed protein product [Chilo suppressalis]|uniref:C2H2-type domain-containing protein n=1 Tax=Chilo suppressalis TaxID=168631 RepID=A0ABN8B4E3_CHISP|nr:unnamed protein product [Chilo suppressalis]